MGLIDRGEGRLMCGGQKRAIEETKAIFPGLRVRIEGAVGRVEGLLVGFCSLLSKCEGGGGWGLMQRMCV